MLKALLKLIEREQQVNRRKSEISSKSYIFHSNEIFPILFQPKNGKCSSELSMKLKTESILLLPHMFTAQYETKKREQQTSFIISTWILETLTWSFSDIILICINHFRFVDVASLPFFLLQLFHVTNSIVIYSLFVHTAADTCWNALALPLPSWLCLF